MTGPAAAPVDPRMLLRGMHERLGPARCHLLFLNSLPDGAPHLAQPDLWSPHRVDYFVKPLPPSP